MFIQVEPTPNPLTLKFFPGRPVTKSGTMFYKNKSEAVDSPFAERMFAVEGVRSVFFGSDFITISKKKDLDWQVLKPMVLGAITDHYNSGEEIINKDKDNILYINFRSLRRSNRKCISCSL